MHSSACADGRAHCADDTQVQVAHFLEADMQRWAAALAAALFAPQPADEDSSLPTTPALGDGAEARRKRPRNKRGYDNKPSMHTRSRERLWQLLDELTPLDNAVDAVLRASRQPLLEQLPLTPAAWQPAVIGSHAVAGALTLHSDQAAACSSAMHAVHDVHTLSIELSPAGGQRNGRNARGLRRALCSAVATLPALHTLDLDLNGIDGGGADEAAVVATLACLPQLACLTVQRECFSRCTVLSRTAFTALTALTSLSITAGYFVADVSALSGLSRLAQLSVVGVGDFGSGALAQPLSVLTTLTALHLECMHDALSSWAVAQLSPALAGLSRLASLELRASNLSDHNDAELTAALSGSTALSRLTLSCGWRSETGLSAIASTLTRLSQLAHLELRYPELAGVPALAPSLSHLTTLTLLDLTGGRGHRLPDTVALAAALGSLSRLESLSLDEVIPRGAGGAAALAPPLRQLTALTALTLKCCRLRDPGATALAPALSCLSHLVALDLCRNRFGAAGAAALAPPLRRLAALTLLDLSGNDFCTTGVQHLAPSLALLTALRQLRLAPSVSSTDSSEEQRPAALERRGVFTAAEVLRGAVPDSVWRASDLKTFGCLQP